MNVNCACVYQSVSYVHSVTEALLMLLDCYYDDEPVIPYDFYQRCVDSADDAALCRQVPPLTAALFHCTYIHTNLYSAKNGTG